MNKITDELRENMEEYFNNITKEQFILDLKKAGFAVYDNGNSINIKFKPDKTWQEYKNEITSSKEYAMEYLIRIGAFEIE